ncbi:putative leucine-rich repeat-containing protein DDB_G0290503 [Nothobranchius furzeri]|uniref:putative leucine-rich repeat-containing protein DDB_G0290503 n=1 Tax=Nothobranchius furzeri TaxID=105023 RepID=UPI0039046E63
MVNRRNVSWYDSHLHPGEMDYESDMDFVSDYGDENSELLSETEEMENDMFDETEHTCVFDAEIESLHYETKLPAELEFPGSETVDSDSETMVPRPQTVQQELAGFKRPRKPQQHLTFAEMMNSTDISWYDFCVNPVNMEYDLVIDFGEDEKSDLLFKTKEMKSQMTEQTSVFDAEKEFSESETVVPRPQSVQQELANFKRPSEAEQTLTLVEMTNSTNMSWYDLCVNNVEVDYDLVIDFSSDGEDEKSDLLSTTKEMESEMPEQTSVFDAEKESLPNETHSSADLEFSGSEMVVPRPQTVQQELADFKSRQIDELLKQVDHLKEKLQNTNTCFNQEKEKRLAAENQCEKLEERHLDLEAMFSREKDEKVSVEQKLTDKLENLKEQLSEKNVFIKNLQTDLDQERRFRLVSVQEQKNAQRKVTVNENYKKEIKDLKKRTSDLSEMLDNIKTDMKYRERILLDERNDFKHQLKQKNLICESLEKRLNKENELRLTCEEELKKTKDQMSSMNGNLKKEINDLTQSNSELRVVVENLTAENAASHQELAEQQERVKHQLQDKSVVCDLLKQVDHLKEKVQNTNTCFNQEKEKRLAAENQCVLYKEQTKEMENGLVEQQQKLVALEKQLQEQKNVNEDLQKICSDLKGETDESRFSGVSRDVLIENFEKLEERHLDLEVMFSREKDEKISVEQKLTDKLENLKEQLSEKNVFIKNLQTDLDQERRFRLVSVQEQKNAQHKVTVNENFKKEIKDLKKRNGDLSEMLDNIKTDLKNGERKLLEEQNDFKHQLKQKNLICESLEKRLNKENELRLTCEEELKKTKDQMSSMNGNLKKEINDLKRRNTDLSQTLRSGQAVVTKSEQMFEDLQKFKQLLHEKMSVCEELSRCLDMEKQLRVSYEAQLDSNRAIVCENSDLKEQIKDLTQSNSELRVVVENLTAENAASHQELAEQQERVKHQLQDKSVACDLLKQVDHLKEKVQNRNTCFNQEKEKRLAAENQCALYKEQTKEMENGLVEQQQKLVALEKQLQEQKNVNEDLQKICSDLKGETDESRFSGVSRDVLIENFEKLEERHLDLEVMFSREKDEKISVEQKLTDKLENLKEQLSEKNVFIKNLQTDLDQERRFRLVSVQEQKNAQHKVTVNENFKKEIKDLKKRNGDLSEMLDNIKTDLKNGERKLLEEQNDFKHQLKQKNLICESLEKRLNKENELRLTCEEELKKTKDQMSSMNGNLKKEINNLKRRNTDLSQTLRSGQAVVTKSEQMFEDLQKFKQLLHEKMSVCEELSRCLDMEKQLRVSYEAQLDSNRAIVCENSDLKEQIKDLTQSNSELRVVVENLTAENAASHQELAEQQERVKHQLQDKSVACDLLKQVDHLKEKVQNRNTCFNQEKEKRLAAENQCALYKEQTKEMENGLVEQQQKLVTLEKQLQEQKNVNEDLQKICSDLKGETDESRFSGVSRDVLIENFEKLEERHLDLEVMFSREKDEKISVEQKLTDKLENLKEQLSEKNVFIKNLQTDLDQERRFRLVSVQEQKNAQHKVTVNENFKKEIKDLKKRNGDLSEMLDNVKTDLKNGERKLLEEQNDFKHQLKQKNLICESLEKRLNKENELRLTCEEELKKTKDQMSSMNGNLKKEINDLKRRNTDLSQTLRSGQAVVTKSEQMCEDLQKFKQLLHEKMSICEELSSSLDMEKQLRVSYEAQLDSNRTIVGENSDLKEQIKDLTQSNSELRVVVENLTAENAASHQELAEQLETVKHQLQDKSVVCENLETGFTNEQKLRLQLYQQLQETSGLCESLENQLRDEQKIRLGLETELAQNRDVVSAGHDDLTTKLKQMEEKETKLRKAVAKLQLDLFRSKKQHEEELGILKEQASELESLTTNLESQNQILRQKTERVNPDQQTKAISEQNVDAAEGNESLPAENDSLAESLESQRDAPHSDTKKQEKVSVWRHFKKFVTPGCLRQHKNKQPSN